MWNRRISLSIQDLMSIVYHNVWSCKNMEMNSTNIIGVWKRDHSFLVNWVTLGFGYLPILSLNCIKA